jgi:hypothetical protein
MTKAVRVSMGLLCVIWELIGMGDPKSVLV